MISTILPVMQTVLAFGNICIIAYAFFRFLGKPHDTLEARILVLEAKQKEIESSLLQGNDRFRQQEDVNEVIIHSTLALIEFEMQYCLTEHKQMSSGLERAKDNLNRFLSKR